MKNLIKGAFILAVSLSAAACGGNGKTGNTDSVKTDSSVHADTSVKVDTLHKDSTAATATDTAKPAGDTVAKTTTTTKTVVKKETKKQ